MKNILKASLVIIGTMVGAGFASGQEIILFFNQYGNIGLVGMLISCIITGVIIDKVLSFTLDKRIQNYTEFLDVLPISSTTKKIINIMITIFLLISFYIMIAGFCSYFWQEFKVALWMTGIGIAMLCYLIFKNDIKGVVSINTILIPFLIIFVFYLGIKNISFSIEYFTQNIESIFSYKEPFQWLISSILYASYNSILLIPILIELQKYMKTKSDIRKTSIICSSIFMLLGGCLYCLILRGKGYVFELELPILQIMKEFGNIYYWIYGIVILTAILTTTISAGYGFLKNVSNSQKKYNLTVYLLCISSIFITPIGFSNLVNWCYPIFGVLGLMQLFFLFWKNSNTKCWKPKYKKARIHDCIVKKAE